MPHIVWSNAIVARQWEMGNYGRCSSNTRWMHGNQEWETSTIGQAVLSNGPARCYEGKRRHEESQCYNQNLRRNEVEDSSERVHKKD
jgi:hypothetical protein